MKKRKEFYFQVGKLYFSANYTDTGKIQVRMIFNEHGTKKKTISFWFKNYLQWERFVEFLQIIDGELFVYKIKKLINDNKKEPSSVSSENIYESLFSIQCKRCNSEVEILILEGEKNQVQFKCPKCSWTYIIGG